MDFPGDSHRLCQLLLPTKPTRTPALRELQSSAYLPTGASNPGAPTTRPESVLISPDTGPTPIELDQSPLISDTEPSLSNVSCVPH